MIVPDTDRTMQVVNHIRILIESGALQPGDRIPPEREFARTLKISRASLRTGIGALAAMGVMKVRHGVGTCVVESPAEFSNASLGLMGALYGFQFWQMFEARLIVESSLAALAAERGREEHHAALAEQVAEMCAIADQPADFLKHDVLFHRIIAQASGNPYPGRRSLRPSPRPCMKSGARPSSGQLSARDGRDASRNLPRHPRARPH
jgi:GntR family transcriptional repressor for pyruvate dehydrogenase complex